MERLMMRVFVPAAAALALLAFQSPLTLAQAQSAEPPVTQDSTAPAAGADQAAPMAPAPAPSAAQPAPHKAKKTAHHQTLQQRFDAANTTHDGKLTKDQAAAANWSYVTRHWSQMDKDNKGYVTVADIHSYAHAAHAAHAKKPAQPATNG
jgi:hypothetical protein